MGFTARAFSSAEEFLKSDTVLRTGCLILDIAMPGMTGPELQRELKRRQVQTPIIFITAHQDEECGETPSTKEQWNVCLSLSLIRPY